MYEPRRDVLTLETLSVDVLRLIFLELQNTHIQGKSSLKALAASSRTLRDIVSPVLFFRYRIHPAHLPPDRIRRFVRHIILEDTLNAASCLWLRPLLDSLSSLNAVTFERSPGVTWDVLELVLSYPRIVSINFEATVNFALVDPYPIEQCSRLPISLTSFSYGIIPLKEGTDHHRWGGASDFSEITRTAQCLAALVPATHNTLTELTLQLQSAPILAIAELSWPHLRRLSLNGHYTQLEQANSLPVLLSSLLNLQTLSLLIARRSDISRAPILGRKPAPSGALSGLRSLILAYPDPGDSVFSVDATDLRRLSIRDWPRHYTTHPFHNTFPSLWASPILTSKECLSILQRLDDAPLTSLELVYQAVDGMSDDDLLSYVACTFPGLTYFELHRYRARHEDPLDHMHIVELVAAAAPHAHIIRLNLDFPEDHGPHCHKQYLRDAWFPRFKYGYGPEIVRTLEERCPQLEHVDLLYHGVPTSTWVEFHPSRCAEPRFVTDESDPERRDSPPVSNRWYVLLNPKPPRRSQLGAAPS